MTNFSFTSMSRLRTFRYNVLTYRGDGIHSLVEIILLNFIDAKHDKEVRTAYPLSTFPAKDGAQTEDILDETNAELSDL